MTASVTAATTTSPSSVPQLLNLPTASSKRNLDENASAPPATNQPDRDREMTNKPSVETTTLSETNVKND